VTLPRVLDVTCGARMMWFDKSNKDAIFTDNRLESHILCDGRSLEIKPDMQLNFCDLPFEDSCFNLVVFDPPHLKNAGPKSWLRAKYGVLGKCWQDTISQGFSECFRVLANNGVLIFKWNEDQVKVIEVLKLTSVKPLFGHPNGRKGLTHWMAFIKLITEMQK
jgi:hypothetical protein